MKTDFIACEGEFNGIGKEVVNNSQQKFCIRYDGYIYFVLPLKLNLFFCSVVNVCLHIQLQQLLRVNLFKFWGLMMAFVCIEEQNIFNQ